MNIPRPPQKGLSLEEKMKRYKTVQRPRCPCGNLWFFEINPTRHECTTCARVEFENVEAQRKADEENERRRRRQSEDEASAANYATTSYAPTPMPDPSPSFDPSPSTSDSGWSGDGGGFSGGGASGEW